MLKRTARHAARRVLRLGFRLAQPRQFEARKYLFLLGHMRSGSSVLQHILTTNPDIVGYGETHLRYSTDESLRDLTADVHVMRGRVRLSGVYDFDKILHDYIGDERLLARPDVFCVFLIREPGGALGSMIHQFPDWFTGRRLPAAELEREAAWYYRDRLTRLEELAGVISGSGRALAMTYAELTEQTGDCFAKMEAMLGLQVPLREDYDVRWTTGQPGRGDRSEKIRRGYLDRTLRQTVTGVSREAMALSQRAYTSCLESLRRHCVHPGLTRSG